MVGLVRHDFSEDAVCGLDRTETNMWRSGRSEVEREDLGVKSRIFCYPDDLFVIFLIILRWQIVVMNTTRVVGFVVILVQNDSAQLNNKRSYLGFVGKHFSWRSKFVVKPVQCVGILRDVFFRKSSSRLTSVFRWFSRCWAADRMAMIVSALLRVACKICPTGFFCCCCCCVDRSHVSIWRRRSATSSRMACISAMYWAFCRNVDDSRFRCRHRKSLPVPWLEGGRVRLALLRCLDRSLVQVRLVVVVTLGYGAIWAGRLSAPMVEGS